MTRFDYQVAIVDEVKRVQALLEHQGYPHCDIMVTFGLRSKTTAGQAGWLPNNKHEILINLRMAKLNWPYYLYRTPGHEVCHIYAVAKYGLKANGHGEYWKRTMQDAGLTPTQYHNYELPTTRKYKYVCKCAKDNVVMLSHVRHHRIQRGEFNYFCSKCKAILTKG
jgi:predicted SprT family Zn-dependent metalloprotease